MEKMFDQIIFELMNIEKEEGVRILFACESGSRAWGFSSKDSDYDVRFVYIHPIDWYLSISEKRDVIERPTNNLLDISGWDIGKALKLFRKSNPPLLEWLRSPIVYLDQYSIPKKLRELSPLVFSPQACMYHYLSMAKGNMREYLKGELVKSKKYFYVLRPILACKWISIENTAPPMEFEKLLDALVPEVALKNEIEKLLWRKKAGEELDYEPRIEVINEFLKREMQCFEEYIKALDKQKPEDEAFFDEIFRETLKEVWQSTIL